MTETKQKESKAQSREGKEEAKMTHLMSYQGPRDQEIRLHNAEFRGKHYLDFRFYDKKSGRDIPTKRGVRLDSVSVGHLEDAILKWKSFVEEFQKDA